MTRYMSNHGINAFAKTKQRLWYDWKKNIYRPRQEWFNHKDPFVEYDFITPGDAKESP